MSNMRHPTTPRFLMIFIILMILCVNVQSQQMETAEVLSELEARLVITEAEKIMLLEKLRSKPGIAVDKAAILISLSDLAMQKGQPDSIRESGKETNALGMMLGMTRNSVELSERDKEFDDERFSKYLLEVGLIKEGHILEWQKTSEGKEIPHRESAMLLFYSFYADKAKEQARRSVAVEQEFLRLVKLKVIPQSSVEQLETGKLTLSDYPYLAKYASYGSLFKTSELPSDKNEGYLLVYETISKCFPELDFLVNHLEFEHIQDERYIYATVRLEVNGKLYTDTFKHQRYAGVRTLQDASEMSLNPRMINLFNEALIDNNSLYKLYYLPPSERLSDFYNYEAGFIFLSRKQYLAIKTENSKFPMLGPSPGANMNEAIRKEVHSDFLSYGFIDQLDPNFDFHAGLTTIDLLKHYQILYKQQFRVDPQNNYSKYLLEIARVIGPEYTVEPIRELWNSEQNSVQLGFLHNGSHVDFELDIEGQRMDKRFRDWLHQSFRDANFQQELRALGRNSEDLGVGYFSPQQLLWIKWNVNAWTGKVFR